MTRHEAFEILGVDPSATTDEIRRAYLRALPRHKPERDPEGFRRLREAFETASESAVIGRRKLERTVVVVPPLETPEEPRDPSEPAEPADGSLHRLAAQAEHLSIDGEPADVVEAVERIAAMAERTAAWVPSEPLLRASLRLTARGYDDEAKRILACVRALRGDAVGVLFGSEEAIFLWIVARELAELSMHFPPNLKEEIAASTADPEVGRPGDSMHSMAMNRPLEARDAAAELQARAPSLHALYGHLLSGPGSAGGRSNWWTWVAAMGFVFMVLRLADGCSAPQRSSNGQRMAEAVQTLAQQTADEVSSGLDVNCAEADPATARDCSLGYALLQAYAEKRCGEATSWLSELAVAVETGESSHVQPATLDRLETLHRLVCGLRPSYPPYRSRDDSDTAR